MKRNRPNPLQMRPAWRDPADRGPLLLAARHPWIMVNAIVLCLGAAWAYVRYVPPEFTSTSLVRLRQGGPVPLGQPEQTRSGDDMNAYLNAELAVMTSAPVLQQAIDANPRLAKELSALDPIAAFKRRLRAAVGRKDGIITVAFDDRDPGLAAEVVNSVVNAYTAEAAKQEEALDRNMRGILAKVRAEADAASAAAMAQMVQLRKDGYTPTDARDPEQETAAARASARTALVDVAVAKAHADEAVAALGNDPKKLAELEKLVGSGTVGPGTDVEDAETRLAIREQEVKYRDYVISQRLLTSHPQVVAVQERLDKLRMNYAATARVRWAQARDRAEQMAATLRDQETAARAKAERAATYARAEAELARIDRYAATLDDRMQELRAREASGALNVSVVEPARPAKTPARPDVPRTFALATGAGAVLGALASYLREAARCRRPMLPPSPATPFESVIGDDDDLGQAPPPPARRARPRSLGGRSLVPDAINVDQTLDLRDDPDEPFRSGDGVQP